MKLFNRKMGKKQKAALNALADGIECGAKLRPQTWETLFQYDAETDGYASCALGAAWECALLKQGKSIDFDCYSGIGNVDYGDILTAYGVVNRNMDRLIEIDEQWVADTRSDISGLIWGLNDRLEWSREHIAQFLRDLE